MSKLNIPQRERLDKLKEKLEQQSPFTLYTNDYNVLLAYERMIQRGVVKTMQSSIN